MPNYVTESSYTEDIPARTYVGDAQDKRTLAIMNLETGKSQMADGGFAEKRDPRWEQITVELSPGTSFGPDAVAQVTPAAPALAGPLLSFEGLGPSLGWTNLTPTDANGDVGPNHYVQVVNSTLGRTFRVKYAIAGASAAFGFQVLTAGRRCS